MKSFKIFTRKFLFNVKSLGLFFQFFEQTILPKVQKLPIEEQKTNNKNIIFLSLFRSLLSFQLLLLQMLDSYKNHLHFNIPTEIIRMVSKAKTSSAPMEELSLTSKNPLFHLIHQYQRA